MLSAGWGGGRYVRGNGYGSGEVRRETTSGASAFAYEEKELVGRGERFARGLD